MREGFTYRGKHCEQLDLHFIPGPDEIRNRMETYSVSSAQVAGRHGGYYYGSTADERVFELDCYFEGITEKQYAAIQEWLRRDEGGELIFDDRPYIAYDVFPTKQIKPTVYMSRGDIEMLLNGKLKITFTAYNPFGRMLVTSYEGTNDLSGAMNDTGILPTSMMPPAPKLEDKTFLMYNCGTEKASTLIRIAGEIDEDGLTITNTTNGTSCRIVGMDPISIAEGTWLEIDSDLGQVYQMIGSEKRLAFEHHDLGYITLDPCTPIVRDALVTYEAGSRVVINSIGAFADVKAGQYIYLEGGWRYIGRVLDKGRLELSTAMENSGVAAADVVTMNTIVLSGNATLTKFEIEYTPRTR